MVLTGVKISVQFPTPIKLNRLQSPGIKQTLDVRRSRTHSAITISRKYEEEPTHKLLLL